MQQPVIFEHLSHLKRLQETAPGLLAEVSSGFVRVAAGHTLPISVAGDICLHLMTDGWALQAIQLDDGRRHAPSVMLPGDLVDLDRLAIHPVGYDVTALTACRFVKLSRERLRSAMERDRCVAEAFLQLAMVENADLVQRNLGLACHTAQQRVAGLLCRIASRFLGSAGQSTEWPFELTIPLSQNDFGDLLGLSTVHVYRVFQNLATGGLIQRSGRRLEILDWKGLVAVSRLGGVPTAE